MYKYLHLEKGCLGGIVGMVTNFEFHRGSPETVHLVLLLTRQGSLLYVKGKCSGSGRTSGSVDVQSNKILVSTFESVEEFFASGRGGFQTLNRVDVVVLLRCAQSAPRRINGC